ncbi:hypothetical protein NDU88_007620 [Pleurodeles waltl]|uniref:Uncharacterized protein n=1 Tax=Pleurodeles waltl TaxID=8319 RepID=A0AAV7NXX0_PLEWA|nr:hypothetical protein NDU88_007620 [Pleurodeles waltl]
MYRKETRLYVAGEVSGAHMCCHARGWGDLCAGSPYGPVTGPKRQQSGVLSNNASPSFTVECAHRIPSRAPSPGPPARPLIARLLNFRDRDQILQGFRSQGPRQLDNNVIMAYPKYTMEVQRRMYHTSISSSEETQSRDTSPQIAGAESQAQALKDANQFTSAQYTFHREDRNMDPNSLQGHSCASTSPSLFGPELTQRMADDILTSLNATGFGHTASSPRI